MSVTRGSSTLKVCKKQRDAVKSEKYGARRKGFGVNNGPKRPRHAYADAMKMLMKSMVCIICDHVMSRDNMESFKKISKIEMFGGY